MSIHAATCPLATVPCSYSDLGCEFKVNLNKIFSSAKSSHAMVCLPSQVGNCLPFTGGGVTGRSKIFTPLNILASSALLELGYNRGKINLYLCQGKRQTSK